MAKLILVALVGTLVIAACGSASDDVPSLRSIEDVQAVEPTASTADTVLENEAKMMAFTQCLRDQGLEVLDPVVDADGNVGKPELAEGIKWDKKRIDAAWKVCDEHLEGFTFEKESVDVSERVDQWVAVAACLRDKGYEVDEPTAETLDQWMGDFKNAINWDDPVAVADYEQCSGDEAAGTKGK
jgi:hypothetical protein